MNAKDVALLAFGLLTVALFVWVFLASQKSK